MPLLALDELPYLTEATPELPSLLQRYVDAGTGPALILSGSALSTMGELVEARAPLYGRAAAVVVPAPLAGADLAALWETRDPLSALWVDAALGGLPGYRPLVPPPGRRRARWIVDEVLAPGSPLLDAAEADLAGVPDPPALRGVYRAILGAIADGAEQVWAQLGETSWPSQMLGPRWEAVARAHLAAGGVEGLGPVDAVGATTVSDRSLKRGHEVDLVAMRAGGVVALGEAKLRALGPADLERLQRARDLLDVPQAKIVLASARGVDARLRDRPDLIAIEPADVYGRLR